MKLSLSCTESLDFLSKAIQHTSKINDWIVLFPLEKSLMVYSTSSCSCLFTSYTINVGIFDEYSINHSQGYKVHGKALYNLIKPKNLESKFIATLKLENDRLEVYINSFMGLIKSSKLILQKVTPMLASITKNASMINLGNLFPLIFGYFKNDSDIVLQSNSEITLSSFNGNFKKIISNNF